MSRSHLKFAAKSLFISNILLLAAWSAWAQTSVLATITGVITDPSGAAIPAVSITATNAATHATAKTSTNPSGNYVLPNLPSGDYNVRAEKEGFRACETLGVHLDPAVSVQVSCAMKLGQVTQTVEIHASAIQVQTTDAKVTRTVDATQMQDLPVNGRNIASLYGLQPGVVQGFTFNSFQAQSLGATQSTQVNGLIGDANNILIDGAPSTRTRANGFTVAPPSIEGVAEVNIVTGGYMPEYSRAAGGQFAVITKSGGDHYHGDAYEFLRNDALDSRNFFSATVPKLRFNDFGFTIGGPVIPKHHNLYFFLAEEWQRKISGSTTTGTVPTANDKLGNLGDYCQVFKSTCPKVPAYLNGVTSNGVTLVAGQPFPNNVIPQGIWSTTGSAMVKNFYLPPNTVSQPNTTYPYEGGINFITLVKSPSMNHFTNVKADYILNDKNRIAVSIRHYYGWGFSAAGSGASSAVLNTRSISPGRGGSVDFTSTLSPTLLNDFTVGANEDINYTAPSAGSYGGNGANRQSLGINFPYIIPGGAASKGRLANQTPGFSMSGFDGVSSPSGDTGSVGHVYTLQDVITKIRGNHTIKVGAWFEHDGERDNAQGASQLNGSFSFTATSSNPSTTRSPLADALLGNTTTYSEYGWRNNAPWVAHQLGFFAQDSWKVMRGLTIQGGLRWDYFQPFQSSWGNIAILDPLFYSLTPGIQQVVDPKTGYVTGNPYNGIAIPGFQLPTKAIGRVSVLGQLLTAANYAAINTQLTQYGMLRGLPAGFVNSHYGNWQPRLGIAWDPTGSGKSSIRAAAGIYYNLRTVPDGASPGADAPFQLFESASQVKADCPGATLDPLRNCLSTGATIPALPLTIYGKDLNNPSSAVYSWNFGLQHMFFNNTLVGVGYVGNQGRHLPVIADLNQPPVGTFNLPANAGINVNALRPYPGFGTDWTFVLGANSRYDSLQVTMQRRLTNGLQYQLAYTYQKALADAGDVDAFLTNSYDPRYNWGVSSFNQTHSLIPTWVYDLPIARHSSTMLGKVVGGWRISGVVALVSGHQFAPTTSTDPLGTRAFTERAYVYPNCNYRGNRTLTKFFNTSCFYNAVAGTPGYSSYYGTVAPNAIEGPGIDNIDFALMKNGPVTEWMKYQFRAEFFNFFNHPSFSGVSTSVNSSTFGQVTSANSPRNIQFGLKLFF